MGIFKSICLLLGAFQLTRMQQLGQGETTRVYANSLNPGHNDNRIRDISTISDVGVQDIDDSEEGNKEDNNDGFVILRPERGVISVHLLESEGYLFNNDDHSQEISIDSSDDVTTEQDLHQTEPRKGTRIVTLGRALELRNYGLRISLSEEEVETIENIDPYNQESAMNSAVSGRSNSFSIFDGEEWHETSSSKSLLDVNPNTAEDPATDSAVSFDFQSVVIFSGVGLFLLIGAVVTFIMRKPKPMIKLLV